MPAPNPLRLYQQQAVRSAPPAVLIDKLYGIGLAALQAGDATRARRALVELTGALDAERGGELAQNLQGLYDFSLRAINAGDLGVATEILSGLRDAWRQGVLAPPALAA